MLLNLNTVIKVIKRATWIESVFEGFLLVLWLYYMYYILFSGL